MPGETGPGPAETGIDPSISDDDGTTALSVNTAEPLADTVESPEYTPEDDKLVIGGHEFDKGDSVVVKRTAPDGTQTNENDWTIDSDLSTNGRVVVRRKQSDGTDDVKTIDQDEFLNWQGLTPTNPPTPVDKTTPRVSPDLSTMPPVPPRNEADPTLEEEGKIAELDAIIREFAGAAQSESNASLNKYSNEQNGLKVKNSFQGVAKRFLGKALVGGSIGAVCGGIFGGGLPGAGIGALSGVAGAAGSELGIGLAKGLRRLSGDKGYLEELKQLENTRLSALLRVANEAIEVSRNGDPVQASQKRLEFFETVAELSDPKSTENQRIAELEAKHRKVEKRWRRIEGAMSLIGGILAGGAFTGAMRNVLAERGLQMGGGGLGSITEHSQVLQGMQDAGHHVHEVGGQVLFDYQVGEVSAIAEAAKNAPTWLQNALRQSWTAVDLGHGALAHEAGAELTKKFNHLIWTEVAKRMAGILAGIGVTTAAADAISGRRVKDGRPAIMGEIGEVTNVDLDMLRRTALKNPEPKIPEIEKYSVGSAWQLKDGVEDLMNDQLPDGVEVSPNFRFVVTSVNKAEGNLDSISLKVVDQENGIVDVTDASGKLVQVTMPENNFFDFFEPAEAAPEPTGPIWEEIDTIGVGIDAITTGKDYEVNGKKFVVTKIEELELADDESEKKFRITFTNDVGKDATTDDLTADQIEENLNDKNRDAFIQNLFAPDQPAEEEEDDDVESEGELEPAVVGPVPAPEPQPQPGSAPKPKPEQADDDSAVDKDADDLPVVEPEVDGLGIKLERFKKTEENIEEFPPGFERKGFFKGVNDKEPFDQDKFDKALRYGRVFVRRNTDGFIFEALQDDEGYAEPGDIKVGLVNPTNGQRVKGKDGYIKKALLLDWFAEKKPRSNSGPEPAGDENGPPEDGGDVSGDAGVVDESGGGEDAGGVVEPAATQEAGQPAVPVVEPPEEAPPAAEVRDDSNEFVRTENGGLQVHCDDGTVVTIDPGKRANFRFVNTEERKIVNKFTPIRSLEIPQGELKSDTIIKIAIGIKGEPFEITLRDLMDRLVDPKLPPDGAEKAVEVDAGEQDKAENVPDHEPLQGGGMRINWPDGRHADLCPTPADPTRIAFDDGGGNQGVFVLSGIEDSSDGNPAKIRITVLSENGRIVTANESVDVVRKLLISNDECAESDRRIQKLVTSAEN